MCSSGLEALTCPFSTKFFRSKDLRFTTSPAIATYTLLPAGVLVHRFCKPLSLLSFRVIFLCRVGLCVCVFYFFLKGWKKYFEILSAWKGGSSFASFGLCLGLCGLQMCLHLCDGS